MGSTENELGSEVKLGFFRGWIIRRSKKDDTDNKKKSSKKEILNQINDKIDGMGSKINDMDNKVEYTSLLTKFEAWYILFGDKKDNKDSVKMFFRENFEIIVETYKDYKNHYYDSQKKQRCNGPVDLKMNEMLLKYKEVFNAADDSAFNDIYNKNQEYLKESQAISKTFLYEDKES